jgi:hypothetical protein
MSNFEKAKNSHEELMQERYKHRDKTADEMFRELRYVTTLSNESFIYYHCVTNNITFNLIDKEVIASNININEHLAIHQKMKELGWLDE